MAEVKFEDDRIIVEMDDDAERVAINAILNVKNMLDDDGELLLHAHYKRKGGTQLSPKIIVCSGESIATEHGEIVRGLEEKNNELSDRLKKAGEKNVNLANGIENLNTLHDRALTNEINAKADRVRAKQLVAERNGIIKELQNENEFLKAQLKRDTAKLKKEIRELRKDIKTNLRVGLPGWGIRSSRVERGEQCG